MRTSPWIVALTLCLLAPAPIGAEAPIAEHLRASAASGGAYGVLRALEEALVADPTLVATAPAAGQLAADALEALGETSDAATEHERAVGVLIVAFAPPGQRDAVAEAVAARMPRPADGDRAPAEPELRVGSFRAYPGLGASLRYDDNLFATERGEVDDLALVLSPTLALDSDWSRHELDFGVGGDFGRYQENPDEDYEDFFAGGDFRYDLSSQSNLFGGASFRREHEERASPDDVNGEEPTRYDQTSVYLGGTRRFDRLGLRLGGTVRDLDFDDVPAFFGEINNDDRDRRLVTGGGEASWRLGPDFGPRTRIFARLSTDLRRYDQSRDEAGFERDSDGWRAEVGTEFWVGRSAVVEFFAGWMRQDFDDRALEDVSKPSFGATAEWSPAEGTWLTAYVGRTLEETTLPFASSFLTTRVGAALDRDVTPRTSWRLAVSWARNDYQGVGREDDLYLVSASLRHRIAPALYIEPGYRFVYRDSSAPGESYDRNQLFLRVTAEFSGPDGWRTRAAPRGSADVVAATLADLPPTDFSGFYLGAQAGFDSLASPMRGPRRMGSSSLEATFGDHGGSAGLFAGVGTTWRCLYLGVEIDGELSDTDWTHDSRPDVRFFKMERESSYGASLRIGTLLQRAGLLYARLGAQRTRFETSYERNAIDLRDRDSDTAFRYGVGLEAGGFGRSFVRMDYSFVDYDDVDVELTAGADRFDRREGIFRLGLGYRFHSFLEPAPERQETEHPALDLGGFYVGGQVSHGAVTSELEGPRGGGTGSLVADFGDQGFTWGALLGWGHSFGRWYAGLELEGEASEAKWDHFRPGLDRSFSLEKRSTVGAGLRLGYQLPSGALLFGRVAGVHSRFRTLYVVEGNFVDEEDGRAGLRFGGGLEVPASEHVSVRADYTFTRYEQEDVDYALAVDKIDPEESLFRMSLVYRF
ncbi:MAG: outer membrane beta-barrel protein [Deltaproteobacteria bacterium]|nr:outer membrane beta-barrel protein [Deltaproteobacteria bacterium]MBW2361447.1 outer membrane beta-barrel protein [Deltaproteobacteria bacterium]